MTVVGTDHDVAGSVGAGGSWAERRSRLERSLHDGAQQHLLAIQIALVEAALPRSDVSWRVVSSALCRRLGAAIDEIASLADGHAPRPFVAGDVVGSIRRLGAASRLEVVDDLPGSVPAAWWERLVFDLCTEALYNAAVSGRASAAAIGLAVEHGVVTVAVTDDGVGGAQVVAGHGLDGLRGRFLAAGGSLTVDDGAGGVGEAWRGTIVRGTLPAAASVESATPERTASGSAAGEPLDLATRRGRALDRMMSIRLSVGSIEPLARACRLLEDSSTPVDRAGLLALLAEVRADVDESSEALRLVVRRLRAWVPDDPSLPLDTLLGDAAGRSRTNCARILDGEPDASASVLVAAVAEEVMFGLGVGADINVVLRRRSGSHRVRIRFTGRLPAPSVAVIEDLVRSSGSEPTLEADRADRTSAGATRIEFEVACGS